MPHLPKYAASAHIAAMVRHGSKRPRYRNQRGKLIVDVARPFLTRQDPLYWRQRAQEYRLKAGVIDDPNMKARLAGFAEGYDRVANRVEQR